MNIDKTKKTIIFDFDGTIADTFEHIVDILDQYSGDFGVEISDKKVLNELRNFSMGDLLKKFRIPKIFVPFIVMRAQKDLGKNIYNIYPFEDIVDVIKNLSKKYNIGIVTSNSKKNIEKFLEKEDMKDLFSFIYSEPTLFGKHKVLNNIVKKYKLDKKNVIYVGDEARDIEASNKANITIISVGWGFNSEKLLKELNGKNYITKPTDIKKKINEIFSI